MNTIPNWTGVLLGRMHNAKITRVDVARKLNVGKAYMSMIFNGERKPSKTVNKETITQAIDALIKERKTKENA